MELGDYTIYPNLPRLTGDHLTDGIGPTRLARKTGRDKRMVPGGRVLDVPKSFALDHRDLQQRKIMSIHIQMIDRLLDLYPMVAIFLHVYIRVAARQCGSIAE